MTRTLCIRTQRGEDLHHFEVARGTTADLTPQFDTLVATIKATRGEPDSFLPARSSGCHATWGGEDPEANLTIFIDMGD